MTWERAHKRRKREAREKAMTQESAATGAGDELICSHCNEARGARCSFADCPFEVEALTAALASLRRELDEAKRRIKDAEADFNRVADAYLEAGNNQGASALQYASRYMSDILAALSPSAPASAGVREAVIEECKRALRANCCLCDNNCDSLSGTTCPHWQATQALENLHAALPLPHQTENEHG